MTEPPLIGPADVVRAIRRLDAPPRRWAQIAALLGFELGSSRTARRIDDEVSAQPVAGPQEGSGDLRKGPTASAGPKPPPRRRPPARPIESELRHAGRQMSGPPAWLSNTDPLPRPSDEVYRGPPPAPLIEPARAARTLAALAATASDEGPLDALAAVAILAREEPLERLPRILHPTLSRGVHLLLDMGPGMTPFAADRRAVAAELRRVVGEHAVDVQRFVGSPPRGAGTGSRREWAPWRPPRRPRPILVVSDLGLGWQPVGEPDAGDEWERFMTEARQAGCPAAALVPYPLERVPRGHAGGMPIVPWDRTTSATVVRRQLGRLRVVGP